MIPERILIAREEGYHTDQIGTFGGGQFMAFVVRSDPGMRKKLKDIPEETRWYAVLHTFDANGNHLETRARFAGNKAHDGGDAILRAEAMLEEMLAELGPVQFGNIVVRLFQTEIDGQTFGLVDDSVAVGRDAVELLPNHLGFAAPWDGTYDT